MFNKRKQFIPGTFGITWKHRDEKIAAEIPELVNEKRTSQFKCNYSPQLFDGLQELSIHIRCVHPRS